MRIALISDIHGNLTALETVLADIRTVQVDQVVCLGDVAATGPQPREVVTRLRELNISCVLGNGDEELFNLDGIPVDSESMQRVAAISRWNAAQLSPADLDFLRAFKPTITLSLSDSAKLLCYHGSPRSNTEIITATIPDAELAPMVSDCEAMLLAGGHTHTRLLRRYQDKFILNPGAVGLPVERSGTTAQYVPWAEYALVVSGGSKIGIEFRRVPLDTEAIKREALAGEMPYAEWWASMWRSSSG